jgi:hypothetical protein
MITKEQTPCFSVFGGALSKLGLRLGLIREGNNSTRFGIAIGFSAWIILLVLSLLEDSTSRFFSLNILAGHVRLLVTIPLFFICETLVAPHMAEFVDYLVKSGLVTTKDLPSLSTIIHRVNQFKDSWIVDGIIFLMVFIVPHFLSNTSFLGNSANSAYIIMQDGGHLTFENTFYMWFCLPLFRFLLARWFWHLGLWWYFLYSTQKLSLCLTPTHSDGVGGLGYLEVVQVYFAPLSMAFSATIAASSAEGIITGSQTFESLYSLIPLVLVLHLIFFIAPLFMFLIKLKKCREAGLKNYMIMTSNYVNAFDQKWVKGNTVTGQSQLGNSDLQSLADLTSSVKVVHDMRMLPVGRKLIMIFIVSGILPFIPLVFMEFNFSELLVLVFKLMAGH